LVFFYCALTNIITTKGVLASLGEDNTKQQKADLMKKHDTGGDGKIGFDEFSKYMVSRTEDTDTDTKDQILESVRSLGAIRITLQKKTCVASCRAKRYIILLRTCPRLQRMRKLYTITRNGWRNLFRKRRETNGVY